MKKLLLYIYLIIFLLALSVNSAIALKCGNDLIQVGDTTWEVRTALTNNGGKIIGNEKAGTHRTSGYYTLDGGRDYISNSEPIEKWFISIPGENGSPYCYELTFIGPILKKIGSGAECK
ncbi:MAG: hypothetical protein R6V76_10355 [Desulfobacterales bacterium]